MEGGGISGWTNWLGIHPPGKLRIDSAWVLGYILSSASGPIDEHFPWSDLGVAKEVENANHSVS